MSKPPDHPTTSPSDKSSSDDGKVVQFRPRHNENARKKTVTWVSDEPEEIPPFTVGSGDPLPPITPPGVPRYTRPLDVPVSLWANVRAAHRRGMNSKAIALAFGLPFEWVGGFIKLDAQEPGKPGLDDPGV